MIEQPWKDADISAAPGILAAKHRNRAHNFKLLGCAQKLLIDANVTSPRTGNPHRTRFCHAVVARNQEYVAIELSGDETHSEARISNVQTCGCLWSCPVCAQRIMVEKGMLVKQALAWAADSNLVPVMVTLTASHNLGDRLESFKDKFKSAYQLFTNRRSWRSFKESFGVKHHITNTEITRTDNGWHYHKHMLLFVEKNVIVTDLASDAINAILTREWLDALQKRGLYASLEHGLVVSAHGNIGEMYLTKMGIVVNDVGDLSYEMTSQDSKSSRSIWDILRHASYGDEASQLLYVEFVQAMTGENFLTCSHGLCDLIEPYSIEEDAAEEKKVWRHLIGIKPEAWRVVRTAGAYHQILDVAATFRTRAAVKAKIQELAEKLYSDYLEKRDENEQQSSIEIGRL